MKIAIHFKKNDFSSSWIEYCKSNNISYKVVNAYENDIIGQVSDCDGFMWHFHHMNPQDVLFARQLMYSLQASGIKVFPNFNTAWHFDDKVGQKYLLEAIDAPLVPSYVFYSREEASKWINKTSFPKVFKLRKGSGSSHVQLVKNKKDAVKLVNKSFGKGFSQYDAYSNLKERWRKYRLNKTGFTDVLKGIVRLGHRTEFDRIAGKEKGYIYFQDFIPDNQFDYRVIVIDKKAFAIKRQVRKNDFRASGSGILFYEKKNFSDRMIQDAFSLSEKLKSQSLAVDFVIHNGEFLIVEISYGFPYKGFTDGCTGYWDEELNWHEGDFNEKYWMVESLIKEIRD